MKHFFAIIILFYLVSLSHRCVRPLFCPPKTTTTTTTTTISTTTPTSQTTTTTPTSQTTTTSSRVECECGEVNRPSRIAGGNETGPHEYPWNVVLYLSSLGASACQALCEGSLISPRHVLSAAHCVDGGTNKEHV